MKKLLIPLVIIGLLGFMVFAFYAFNMFIYNEKQSTDVPVVPYEATLTGEYVCLSSKDKSVPQTMECAFGLKTEAGEQYALNFEEMGDKSQFKTGEIVTLFGTITPLVVLSTDHWQKYDIEGIFSVKASSKK
ncbi:MAG: hypothetical protein KBC00_00415 [Candidatus Levybacteria bacterium]|nr:hypothetical protein [Candidatus Levybacteria bacterium]MBP9815163.1 hypothetical protein [Candidatus Levybacteria bacterium]